MILVDFPGFHLRLGERLRLRGVKVIQYVAPKLWAWGIGRAPRLRRSFDLVLGVLPFETDFFRKLDINYTYTGSPHKERIENFIKKKKYKLRCVSKKNHLLLSWKSHK